MRTAQTICSELMMPIIVSSLTIVLNFVIICSSANLGLFSSYICLLHAVNGLIIFRLVRLISSNSEE